MWPNDVDGDVFRRMQKAGFDFDLEYVIDINIDFDHWPLSETELTEIQGVYPDVEIIDAEEGEDIGNGKDVGFLQLKVRRKLEYSYIMKIQADLSEKMKKYGGRCDSWGAGN